MAGGDMSSNGDRTMVYEHDLREIVRFIDKVKSLTEDGDIAIESGSAFTIWSKNDYSLGTVEFEEDSWRWVLPADALIKEAGET